MFKFKPKKNNIFFELFSKSTRVVRQGACVLREAMDGDAVLAEERMAAIVDLEHQADQLNDEIVDRLNQTFLTPLDREDIFALATKLDDVIDIVQGTMQRMIIYRTGKPSEGAVHLADLLVNCTDELVAAFDLLKNIKNNQEQILAHSRKIGEIESLGDCIYRNEVAKLFTSCPDPIEIIKWKEVLENLEDALDYCEHIADVLRGIVMKYA